MVNLKPVLERIQRGRTVVAPYIQRFGNAIAPYVLGNVAAAAAMHSGLEHADQIQDMPLWLENTLLYTGLGAFNFGVLVPTVQSGSVNYVRSLFNRNGNRSVPLQPHAKSALLASALALGSLYTPVRDASTSALEKITDDASTVVHYEIVPEFFEPSKPESSQVSVTVSQPGRGEGDQSLENVLQATHDGWRILPYPGHRGEMYSRPRGVEDWAICATDLRTGEYLIDFNCERQQMVASANKIPIMIAYFHDVKEGKLEDNQDQVLERMIRESHNPSTNKILALIGDGDSSQGALRATEIFTSYGFTQTIIEAISPGGRTLGNKSTAGELNTMLAWIYNPSLNPNTDHVFPYTEKMKGILGLDSLSGHSNRITDGKDNCIPTDPSFMELPVGAYVRVYDKTGYIMGANVNSAVVEAHFRTDTGDIIVPYALTMAVQDVRAKEDKVFGRGERWGAVKSEQMRRDSQIIFWHLHKKYTGKSYACNYHRGKHSHEF